MKKPESEKRFDQLLQAMVTQLNRFASSNAVIDGDKW